MSVVRLSPEAVDELVEVAAWYRGQRPGLELEFLAEVDRVLPLIGGSPASFPRLIDVPEEPHDPVARCSRAFLMP